MNNLRVAIRNLRKRPGFALTAILTLGLGIGATSAILGIINNVLLTPLAFGEADRLVRISDVNIKRGYGHSFSRTGAEELLERSRSFEDIALVAWNNYRHAGAEYAELLQGLRATSNLFSVLKIQPILGRSFRPEEHRRGDDEVVLISHRLWQRLFDGQPDAIGQTIRLNERPHEVIGVLPPDFRLLGGPNGDQIIQPHISRPSRFENRGRRVLMAVGRLNQEVTLDQAQGELAVFSEQWALEDPKINEGWITRVELLKDVFVPSRIGRSLQLLFGATALLLLIACANVANLLLSRLHARSTEISIRAALGANRRHLLGQFLTESLVLAMLGGLAGLAVATAGTGLLSTLVPPGLPLARTPGADYGALGIAIIVTLSAFLFFGLWPSIWASRLSVANTLKSAAGHTVSSARKRLAGGLVAGQVALTAVLLVGAGLMIQSILRILEVEVGFNPRHLMQADYQLPIERFQESGRKLAFYENSLRDIAALPGVSEVALRTAGFGTGFETQDGGEPIQTHFLYCSHGEFDYFRAMQTPLRTGRRFLPNDAGRAVIVNETFARAAWPDKNPIGRQVRQGRHGVWMEVVGVAADTRPGRHLGDPRPTVFFPLHAPENVILPGAVTCLVRGQGDPLKLSKPIRKTLHAQDPLIPVTAFRNVEGILRNVYAPHRLYRNLLTAFGLVGLLLAAVGVYGLIAGYVVDRTREIGLRMALGATRRSICQQVLRRGVIWIGLGLVMGLAGALAATRLLSNMLFEVRPDNPGTFLAVSLAVAVVGLLACFLPARRAANIHPMEALRYE